MTEKDEAAEVLRTPPAAYDHRQEDSVGRVAGSHKRSTNKFDWLLRQEPGSLAEQCVLQAFVIAASPRPTEVAGQVFPPHSVWLSTGEIARRCGMHQRTVPATIEKLRMRGLIQLVGRAGRTAQVRVFQLCLEAVETPQETALLLEHRTPQETALLPEHQRLQFSARKTALSCIETPQFPASLYIGDTKEVKQREPNQSFQVSPCPDALVINAYHEVLPELPQVRLQTKTRSRLIHELWEWVLTSTRSDGSRRAQTPDQALTWIRGYFQRVRHNDFLMGRTPRTGEHANWKCDFDFLLTDRGMTHVLEKTEVPA